MPILPQEVGVVSYYNAACRYCVMGIGPLSCCCKILVIYFFLAGRNCK